MRQGNTRLIAARVFAMIFQNESILKHVISHADLTCEVMLCVCRTKWGLFWRGRTSNSLLPRYDEGRHKTPLLAFTNTYLNLTHTTARITSFLPRLNRLTRHFSGKIA